MTWEVVTTALTAVAVLLAVTSAIQAYSIHRRGALRAWKREQRLPAATKFEHLNNLIGDLTAELDGLRDERTDALNAIDDAARQRTWMRDTEEEVKLLESKKRELLELENNIDGNRRTVAEIDEKKEKLEADVRELSYIKENLSAIVNQLNSAKKDLETTEAQVRAKTEQLEKLIAEKDEASSAVAGLRTELHELRAEKEELVRLLDTKDQHRAELKTLEDELSVLRKEVRDAEETWERLEKAKKDIARIESEKDSLEKAVNKRHDELSAAQEKLVKLSSEIHAANNKLTTIRDHVRTAERELQKHRKELANIRNETHNLEKQKKELEGTIRGLQSERDTLSGLLSKLSGAAGEFGISVGETEPSRDPSAAIWEPVFETRKRRDQESEVDALEQLHAYLTSCQLNYTQRALDAFHTSLKVSEAAPLIVLAGVSGTGKSELPRRYAEAVGFNFLSVAVQPRWDSPQDLFGFYDYIDRRFRPTDLTRALVQMDQVSISNENGRGWKSPEGWCQKHCLGDQMLLVLMDEMNLARVEYYFSEFLSRLESRRGIGSHRAAEIPLDVGGRGEKTVMRILSGPNVLFVGTMNEDETTQSLSDKVIDRANILRFGSPKRLELPKASINEAASVEARAMEFKAWKTWLRSRDDLQPKDRTTVDEWIERLRGAMDAAQRPFAYRVSLGILDYVANYPKRDSWLNLAMSDQIEQKIMPKLRGLDPQDKQNEPTFREIRDLIKELEDEDFVHQFDRCCEMNFFQWTGLDRQVERQQV